jgi:hypothetical protein
MGVLGGLAGDGARCRIRVCEVCGSCVDRGVMVVFRKRPHGLLGEGFAGLRGDGRSMGQRDKGSTDCGKRPHGRHGLLVAGFAGLAGGRRVIG